MEVEMPRLNLISRHLVRASGLNFTLFFPLDMLWQVWARCGSVHLLVFRQ